MRFAALFSLFALSTALTAYGCAANRTSHGFDDGSGGKGGDDSGTTLSGGIGGGDFSGSVGSGGGSGVDCSEAAKLIYVLSDDNQLYSYQPQMNVFKPIGTLGCKTSMQPNSMAVDRNATAWVNYVEADPFTGEDSAGAIFKVSTDDASCQPTPITLPFGFYRLGMGFSIDQVGSVAETLYVTGTNGIPGAGNSPGLGKIDFVKNTVVEIGPFSAGLEGESAELTGTGDARLFGFFTTTPVQIAEINKATGATPMPQSLPQVETPIAWAFSFWGGDFYLYTASSPLETTSVTHYVPKDGTTDTAYKTNIGFRIVGAGVSTCAPVEPPQ